MEETKLSGMHNGAVERAIDLRKLLAIIKKNWMVLKGDKIRLIPLLMFPIFMITIFGYATGSAPKNLNTAVVDYDHSGFSQSVVQQLGMIDTFSIKYTVSSQEEGKALLDAGKIKVLIILPQGMGGSVAHGNDAQFQVMVDEADASVAQVAKTTIQIYTQQLSEEVAQARVQEMLDQAFSARQDLAAAKAAALSSDGATAASDSQRAVSSYWGNANYVYKASNAGISSTIQGLHNTLGYLVDQNEIVDSFTPASVASATVALLATGDQQQSVLQEIGSYQGVQGAQSGIMADAGKIYSNYQSMVAQVTGQARAAKVTAQYISSADSTIAGITGSKALSPNPVSVQFLEPYGYGRKAVDFLIPSILALIIFQGASMGLGRAIAGERQDGSLTRVFLTPTSNTTIILGTQIFYVIFETLRSSLIIVVAIALFGTSISGSVLDIVIIIAIFAIGATGIGMVLSVITKTQEQYMAVGMLISLPAMFLSGVFYPVQTMPVFLQVLAQFIPVTYAADALRGVMVKGFTLGQVFPDLLALTVFAVITLTLTLLLFKRELV